MKNKRKMLSVPLLALTLLSQPSLTRADSLTMKSLQGGSSIETAITVAEELNSQTNTYIITTTNDYPDALAGTVLASKYNAPILFVSDEDNQAIFDYLKSRNANASTQFFILGGTGAVSPAIEDQLRTISQNIFRLGGMDRYETVDLINSYLNPKYNNPVIIATGLNYPDALSMGAISGQFQYPIYLINEKGIPESVAKQLKKINPELVYIAGGTGVVPQELEQQIRELAPASTVIRLGGSDRYETSIRIADWFNDKLPERIYTTGEDFHSALVSAPLAAQIKASIVLDDNITPEQLASINQQKGYQVGNISNAKPSQTTTETLTDADIQRLQSYQQFGSAGHGSYVSFQDTYNDPLNRADAEWLVNNFSPATLSTYNNAKVEWLTSPKLVYRSMTSQLCIRGILKLTYSGDNSFGLTPNTSYQREVEYRLRNSVINGMKTLTLEDTKYLSEW